jgi:hypothetical protein
MNMAIFDAFKGGFTDTTFHTDIGNGAINQLAQ